MPDIKDISALEVSPFYGTALHKSTFTYLLTIGLMLANYLHRDRCFLWILRLCI